jgi:hypothetical protein
MNRKKNGHTSMDKLTKGYEEFIKGKETTNRGKEQFEKALKKATKPKQRGSK